MYRGFNLSLKETFGKEYIDVGKKLFENVTKDLVDNVKKLIECKDVINGDKIIEDWFPQINCDVFLSHSHKDKDLALSFAGFLKENFGLNTFIDSAIWGFSDDLLKSIDETFCMNEDGLTFNYEKRNYSTSHVHMMLKSALDKMIDNCEAIFFLNTPNSVTITDSIEEKTNSPWIFSEIATTQLIRKKTPERLKEKTRIFSKIEGVVMLEKRNELEIQYELELNHFTSINELAIDEWKNRYYGYGNALDYLYKICPLPKKFII